MPSEERLSGGQSWVRDEQLKGKDKGRAEGVELRG